MTEINALICEPSGVSRSLWPLSTGLPFAQGVLRTPNQISIADETGQLLPACTTPLATWTDGSIKWALLDTQLSIGPTARSEFRIRTDSPSEIPALQTPLSCTSNETAITVTTGPLTVHLLKRGPRIFGDLSFAGQSILGGDDLSEFVASDAGGTSYPGLVEDAYIEEQNPLRSVVKAEGGFVAKNGVRLLSWQLRFYFFASQPFFKIYHTFVHDQPAPSVDLSQLRFTLPLALAGERCATLGSRNASFGHGEDPARLDRPLSLVQWNLDRHALFGRERIDYRTNAHGWVHLANTQTGITLKLRHPWQNYPKAYTAHNAGLDIDLYPDLSNFEVSSDEPGRRWTEIDREEGIAYDGPLRIPQGMAKTHELFIHCGPAGQSARQIDTHSLAFEEPLLLQLPSEYYAETGALGPFHPFRNKHGSLELKLRRYAQPPNGLGFINYGDQVHLEHENGVLKTRTTENLAYELPRSILRQYLRTGDQVLFREGEAAIFHLMDIDTVHFSSEHPEWVGGPHFQWSQNHHFANTSETEALGPNTSHTWLGGLLDYYFLTGYRRAREVAEACADFCRRQAPYTWKQQLTAEVGQRVLAEDQEWPFSTRTAGWPLTAMGTYYEAFRDERFLRSMEALVDLFEIWQDSEGRWREQVGTFNRGAVPFMDASVLQGLQLYYQCTGDIRTHRLLLRGTHFLAEKGRTAEGIFYYKESPIGNKPHPSTALLLEPLAFVYRQTGDPQILDAGYRLFRYLVDGDLVATYMLKDLFAFLPLLEELGLLTAYENPDFTTRSQPSQGQTNEEN